MLFEVIVLSLAGLVAQQAHYHNTRSVVKNKDNQLLTAELEKRLMEVEKLQRDVNALSIRMKLNG